MNINKCINDSVAMGFSEVTEKAGSQTLTQVTGKNQPITAQLLNNKKLCLRAVFRVLSRVKINVFLHRSVTLWTKLFI